MSQINLVVLMGRVTRDPDIKTFQGGGKVANFSIAINERRKNPKTGEWEDGEATFVDIKAFSNENGRRLADIVEQYVHKGDLVSVQGKLKQESWDDKTSGSRRTMLRVYADEVILMPKSVNARTGDAGEGEARPARGTAPASRGRAPATARHAPDDVVAYDDDVPF